MSHSQPKSEKEVSHICKYKKAECTARACSHATLHILNDTCKKLCCLVGKTHTCVEAETVQQTPKTFGTSKQVPSGEIRCKFATGSCPGASLPLRIGCVDPKESTNEANEAITALNTKEHSPLIIRKMTCFGFPVYIGMICDSNLDDLDNFVKDFIKARIDKWKNNSIQDKRNLAGQLTEALCDKYYPKNEGVAVVFYVDKMWVSSLFGDFMNHTSCRIEFYSLLSTMPHV